MAARALIMCYWLKLVSIDGSTKTDVIFNLCFIIYLLLIDVFLIGVQLIVMILINFVVLKRNK